MRPQDAARVRAIPIVGRIAAGTPLLAEENRDLAKDYSGQTREERRAKQEDGQANKMPHWASLSA